MPTFSAPQQNAFSASIFHRYPRISLALILFISIAILDFALTGIYHFIKYGTIHKHAARRAVGARSSIFHHGLKANESSQEEQWGTVKYTVFTNSLAFRDRAVRTVPLEPTGYRVLFMGDSFTLGMGYSFEDTFVGMIADRLQPRGIEVLNGASASYAPSIYLIKTQHYLNTVGLRFNEMVLAIDISDIADEADCYSLENGVVVSRCDIEETGLERMWRTFHEYTSLHRNVIQFYEHYVRGFINDGTKGTATADEQRYALNRRSSLWTVDAAARETYGREGLDKAKDRMDMLYELLSRYNIKLTIFVYPWPDQIAHHDVDSLHVRFWRNWASERRVRFVDLFPDFMAHGAGPKAAITQYYIPGDVHFNRNGHALVARRLFDELWSQERGGSAAD